MRPAVTRERAAVVALVVGVLCTAVHCATYAYEDDYLQLLMGRWAPFSWWNNDMAAEGRPLYGLFVLNMWKWLGTTTNAIWLRMVGVTGLMATALVLYFACRRRWKLSVLPAICVASVVVLTPSMAVTTFWAAAAPHAWAAAIACLSGLLSLDAVTAPAREWRRLTMSTGLALIAELIYQPMAGFFLVPLALEVILRPDRGAFVRGGRALLHFGLILGTYYILYRLSVAFLFPHSDRAGRGGDLTGLFDNLAFYLFEVLPFVASGWAVFVGWYPAFVAKVAVAAAVLSWVVLELRRRSWPEAGCVVALFAALVCAAGAPLVASGTYAPYRTLSPTAALVLIMAGTGCVAVFRPLLRRVGPWFPVTVALGVTLALAGVFRYMVTVLVVRPQAYEYRMTREWLAGHLAELPPVLTAVAPETPALGLLPYHEFGRYSADFGWSLRTMLLAQLAEVHGLSPSEGVQPLFPECLEVITLDPDDAQWYRGVLVDMRVVLGQIETSPLRPDDEATLVATAVPGLEKLGPVLAAPSGWMRHDDLGWFRPGPGEWIFHQTVGWIAITWIDGPFIILYSHAFGKAWTELADWPMVATDAHEDLIDIHELLPCARLPGRARGE